MTARNSTLRTVSIDEVISSAQINLGLNTDADRIIMLEWAAEANRAIGLGLTNQMQEVIPITDFSFPAPCNMIHPQQIRLIGDPAIEDSVGNQGLISPFYDEQAFIRKSGDFTSQRGSITIQLQGNTFVLSNNLNAGTFQTAEIKFLGMPLDEEGMPLIDEFNKRTCVQYIEYMYVKRQRRRERGVQGAVPQSEVDSDYNKYLRLKAEAISRKKMPNKLRFDDINRKWNTLLPDQKRKTSHPDSNALSGGFFFLT